MVAILSPWTLDPIWVPAERECQPPFIRMEGDFCGMPSSGAWLLWALFSEVVSLVINLVTGAPVTNWGRAFLFLLFALLFVLPLFNTLLLILAREHHRQVFNVVLWGLAAGSGLWLIGRSSHPRFYWWASWGLWLYTGLAACILILEILTLVAERRPRP